ncbi:MAG: MiaB/RimO family radical SAM methylthiotransferase [Coriobacteriales bacterium]|jgi:tRNA-2-methylthio-N6-dimethylallyladenosine synthase|nr:MiaB/RimO family radical SAM methylthiotransferase [Coriobacteriales bacterium]
MLDPLPLELRLPLSQRSARSYWLVTFGCQMNKADSEQIATLLEARGLVMAASLDLADLVVFMTCCVRERADERLFGQVASLGRSDQIICVGGCIGERDGEALKAELPNLSYVFGTAALGQGYDSSAVRREHPWAAWLPIITGCDNFCSYCIVPYVRGRERSKPFAEVLEEVERLRADGVQELTLLGQNVNSYGRDLYGQPRFAELLRAVAASGVPRIRFTTSHPKDLSEATIAAFAELDNVMPALHLAVQSGSDRVLAAMGRHYTRQHYLDLVRRLQAACQDSGKGRIALSTDIIVGFPGESEEDFEATMELVEAVGYSQVFTFIYSRRPGTKAAELSDDTPHQQIQARFNRLLALVQEQAYAANQAEFDQILPVLFEGASKRDPQMLSGRSPRNQTVHAPLPTGAAPADFAGKIALVQISEAKTWYLKGRLV